MERDHRSLKFGHRRSLSYSTQPGCKLRSTRGMPVGQGSVGALLLFASLLVSACSSGGTADAPGETSPAPSVESSIEGVDLVVPEGAFPQGTELAVQPFQSAEPGVLGSGEAGLSFSIDAAGLQPSRPFTVEIDASNLHYSDPSLIYLARWDEEIAAWIPVHTEWNENQQKFTATLDHLSGFKTFIWNSWNDVKTGVSWTANEVKNVVNSGVDLAKGVGSTVVDGINLMATNAAGWLGIRGASPPTCSSNAQLHYELLETATGDQRPVFACYEEIGDRSVRLKLANNRPYGMLLVVPPKSEVSVEVWPGFGVDSGQGAMFGFASLLNSVGVNEAYIPPGGTLAIQFPVAVDQDQVVVEATSTPAYTGLDLAVELVKAIWLKTPDATVEMFNCILAGGASLREIADRYDVGNTLAYLDSVRTCLKTLGLALAGSVYDVGRATLATVPSLLSNLKDTSLTKFEVSNSVAIRRIARATQPVPSSGTSPTWDEIKNAEIPELCTHPPSRLSDGVDPNVPNNMGALELVPNTLVRDIPSNDAGPLTAVKMTCYAGGVGWPDSIMLFSSGGRFYASSSLDDGTGISLWTDAGLAGAGRDGIQHIERYEGGLRVTVLAYRPSDAACCASSLALVTLVARDRSIVVTSVVEDVGD